MPSSRQILDGLTTISNDWRGIAIAWHLVAGALLGLLLAGWRPSKRLAGIGLAVPLLSVSVMAWMAGNPFNGAVFAVAAVGLAGLALLLSREPVATGPGWQVAFGAALVAFGWVYPHFLRTESRTAFLYAAPMGLIPCPTLSAVVGVTLVLGGLGSRSWSLALGAIGLFYGIVGMLKLGVAIDVILLIGAAALCVISRALPRSRDCRGLRAGVQSDAVRPEERR